MIARLDKEDAVAVNVWQNSGAALDVRTSSGSTGVTANIDVFSSFSMYRIGDG